MVRSSGPAFECAAECTQSVAAGARIHLTAAADSTSRFGGWSGACSGTGDCDVTVSADTDVSARFDAVGPVQGQTSIAVQVNGQGTITSSPAGINCGQTCHATFTTAVDLIPTAQTGWRFDGWGGGACTGPGACHFAAPGQAGQAVTVYATFVVVQPPPTADCAGIVPEGLGTSVTATLAGGSCENATSDGAGNVAADASGHWFVFSSAGLRLGDYVAETAIPQDQGFQGIEGRSSGAPPIMAFAMRRPDGTLSAERMVGAGNAVVRAWRASGGGSVVTVQTCGGQPGEFLIDRFDGSGGLTSQASAPGGCNGGLTRAVGDASGSTFLLLSGGRNAGLASDVAGRWFDAAGHPLTDFFSVATGSPKQGIVRVLAGGGVAIQLDGAWIGTVASGATTVQAPPQWLADNANHDFTIVRNRRAYAVLSRGAGDPNTMTLYSTQGNRCGAVTFPVGGLTTGGDGTAIGASGTNGCTKTWWPGLLR